MCVFSLFPSLHHLVLLSMAKGSNKNILSTEHQLSLFPLLESCVTDGRFGKISNKTRLLSLSLQFFIHLKQKNCLKF